MLTISINEVTDLVFGSSPLYISPDIKMLLRLNKSKSFVTTFTSIVRKALKDLELKVPLFIMDKTINVSGVSKTYTFKSNFDEFIKGDSGITEKELELVPLSITSYSDGLLYYVRRVDYFAPTAKFRTGGILRINYTTRYPVTFDSNPHEDVFTDSAKIYGLGQDSGGVFNFFCTLLEYHLCVFLRDQKAQLSFTELPLEILQSAEIRISELETQLQDFWQNPAYYSSCYV